MSKIRTLSPALGIVLLSLLATSGVAAVIPAKPLHALRLTPRLRQALLHAVIRHYESQARYQEVLWIHQDHGDTQRAEAMRASLVATLTEGEISNIQKHVGSGAGPLPKARVTFENGMTAMSKTARDAAGEISLNRELAAPILDQLWGFGLTPVTVAREIDGKRHVIQAYVEDVVSGGGSTDARGYAQMRLFDFIIGNGDRHGDNFLRTLRTENGKVRVIAIDHDATFVPVQDNYQGQREHRHWNHAPELPLEILTDSDTLAKLQAVSPEQIRTALVSLIKPEIIEEVVARRNEVIDTMTTAIADPRTLEPVVPGERILRFEATAITEKNDKIQMKDRTHFEGVRNGAWVALKDVDLSGARSITLNVAQQSRGGSVVEIHLDSPEGELIGRMNTVRTGGWDRWADFTTLLAPSSRRADVYVVFKDRWNARDRALPNLRAVEFNR